MLICPHCGKELISSAKPLTRRTFDYIFKILNVPQNCEREKLKTLMYRVLMLTPGITVNEAFQFLWKVNDFSYKEIYEGLELFFEDRLDKAGYEWQAAVGTIKRKAMHKRMLEKRKVLNLPKEITQ